MIVKQILVQWKLCHQLQETAAWSFWAWSRKSGSLWSPFDFIGRDLHEFSAPPLKWALKILKHTWITRFVSSVGQQEEMPLTLASQNWHLKGHYWILSLYHRNEVANTSGTTLWYFWNNFEVVFKYVYYRGDQRISNNQFASCSKRFK